MPELIPAQLAIAVSICQQQRLKRCVACGCCIPLRGQLLELGAHLLKLQVPDVLQPWQRMMTGCKVQWEPAATVELSAGHRTLDNKTLVDTLCCLPAIVSIPHIKKLCQLIIHWLLVHHGARICALVWHR